MMLLMLYFRMMLLIDVVVFSDHCCFRSVSELYFLNFFFFIRGMLGVGETRSPLGAGVGAVIGSPSGIGAGAGGNSTIGDRGRGVRSPAPPRPVAIPKGEPSFYLFGFIMCLGATAARALKSVLQGILLSSEGEKLNSMNLVLYMAPIAVLFLVPATFLMEENMVGITIALARDDIKIIFYLLFNSALAYCVNFTNFLVTKHTSPLTLQVLGNAKGAVAVVISILIFKNPISATGMMGYLLTIIGVVLYSTAKKRSK